MWKEKDKDLDWRSRLDTDFAVRREDALIVTEPHITPMRLPAELRPQTALERKKENKKILGALVAARATREALRDLLSQSQHSVSLGAWSSKNMSKRYA